MLTQAFAARAGMIVLPETVWLRTLQLDQATPDAQQPIAPDSLHRLLFDTAQGVDTLVILGIDAQRDGRTYNATTAWDTDGLVGLYRKRRLVPFAEYPPLLVGRLAPRNRIHGDEFQYSPGHGAQLIVARGTPLGVFICQEVMFPGLIRRSVREGAALLVSTGNDGVFRSPAVALEQANLASLRAVESGRYLIRCMKTGISAVIDPQGRVMAEGPLNRRMIVEGVVHPLTHKTLYTRFGDWVVWLSALIVAASWLTGRGRSGLIPVLSPHRR